MKLILTIIIFCSFWISYAQVEGTYVSIQPKKYKITLIVNPDSTYKCTLYYPKFDATEFYSGEWKLKLYILRGKMKNKAVISSYKIVKKNGKTIAKGDKPWGRIRLFRKKKNWLSKE
tara:strand:- start:82 stop:432 length:351 start_codon:yes stop_codon:yes gene_type:complete